MSTVVILHSAMSYEAGLIGVFQSALGATLRT